MIQALQLILLNNQFKKLPELPLLQLDKLLSVRLQFVKLLYVSNNFRQLQFSNLSLPDLINNLLKLTLS